MQIERTQNNLKNEKTSLEVLYLAITKPTTKLQVIKIAQHHYGKTARPMEQNPEARNKALCPQLINFHQGTKTTQGKEQSLQQMVPGQLDIHK
jgi:hypothetical protein